MMFGKSKRYWKDKMYQGLISSISLIGLVVLIAVFMFVFKNGSSLLSWDLLTGDYNSTVYNGYFDGEIKSNNFIAPSNLDIDSYFSSRWGIAIKDSEDTEGPHILLITYVDINSPLKDLPDKKINGENVNLSNGQSLQNVMIKNTEGLRKVIIPIDGAMQAANQLDEAEQILDIMFATAGKAIRGSLITTLYLIIMTLVIALPIGVFTAIYLHEFAPKNSKIVMVLRRLIEMLTGVPSIIFGLLGAAVFIPLVSTLTGSDTGNLISGSLTLAVIILPVIISSTEETLKTIPDEYRQASLALGAKKSKTTFKIILK